MKTIFIIFFFLYLILGAISMYRGLALKKWYNWLIGAYGFGIGFWLGIVWSDFKNAIIAGMIFAFAPLYQGAINHGRREKNKDALKAWLDNPETEQKHPFLKRFVEWFNTPHD